MREGQQVAADAVARITAHHDGQDADFAVAGGAVEVAASPRPARRGRRGARRAGAAGSSLRAPDRRPRSSTSKLGVLVCSDDPFTRRAFSSGASARDITVVADASLTDAVETVAAGLQPDVVVLDVQVAANRALSTIKRLH